GRAHTSICATIASTTHSRSSGAVAIPPPSPSRGCSETSASLSFWGRAAPSSSSRRSSRSICHSHPRSGTPCPMSFGSSRSRRGMEPMLEAYAAAVRAKDADAFIDLYADDVRNFDLWNEWSYDGKDELRVMVAEWFGSLGDDEEVLVEWDDV